MQESLQLELPSPAAAGVSVVVYRSFPAGTEFLVLWTGGSWSLPAGSTGLAESPTRAAERVLREQTGLALAAVETGFVDASRLVMMAEADVEADPPGALHGWFGQWQIRALDLGADGRAVEHVAAAVS